MTKTIANSTVRRYLHYRGSIKGNYLLLVAQTIYDKGIITLIQDAAARYGDTILYKEEEIVNMSYPSYKNPRLCLFVIKLKENV